LERPFRLLSESDVHAWRAFRLVSAQFEAPGGERFERTFLRHPGAVGIVAVDGDDAVLVRQYRPALDRTLLEIPAGTLDRPGEDPLDCAVRELAEEVGATAAHWEHLATYGVAVGVSDEMLHLYLATGLTFGARAADGIEEQSMTVERFAWRDVLDGVVDGRLADAKTILGLLLLLSRV
jgi:ADP-ribose pyrophosphatase